MGVDNAMAKFAFGANEREEYLAKLVPNDSYFLPNDIHGVVKRADAKNPLHSSNAAVNALLAYVHKRLAQMNDGGNGAALAQLEMPPNGCQLTLRLGQSARNKAFLWDQAVSIPQKDIEEYFDSMKTSADGDRDVELGSPVSQKDVEAFLAKYGMKEEKKKEEEEEEDENYTQISTYALLETIQRGSRTFGDKAKLTWKTLAPLKKIDAPGFFRRVFGIICAKFGALVKDIYITFKKGGDGVKALTMDKIMSLFQMKSKEIRQEVEEVRLAMEPKVMTEARKKLKQMKTAKFAASDDLHENLASREEKPFDFLQSVRYEFDSVPANRWFKGDARKQKVMRHLEENSTKSLAKSKSSKSLNRSGSKGSNKNLSRSASKGSNKNLNRSASNKSAGSSNGKRRVRRENVQFTEKEMDWYLKNKWKLEMETNEAAFSPKEVEWYNNYKRKNNNNEAEFAPAQLEWYKKNRGKLQQAADQAVFTPDEMEWYEANKRNLQKEANPANAKWYRSCDKLKDIVLLAIYGGKEEGKKRKASEKSGSAVSSTGVTAKIHAELRGRMGANAVLSIMNAKRMKNDMILGLCLSMAGTGMIAFLVDFVLYAWLISLTLTSAGAFGPLTVPLMFIIPSLSPLIAETFDSFVIKRLMSVMRGQPFWPRTAKEFWRNLGEAFVAGAIASLGSMPYNALTVLTAGWGYMPLKALANFLGTSTSAAMVPLEINKMGGHTGASVMLKMRDGFLRRPDAVRLINHLRAKKGLPHVHKATQADIDRAELDYVKLKTERVMRVAQASAMSINSMGTGAMLSFFCGFLMFYIPGELGWIKETTMELASTLFNSPTEAISMTAQTFGANAIGSGKYSRLTSTDGQKNELMLEIIFQKATQQLEEANKIKAEAVPMPISYGEVHAVFRPLLIFTAPMGEAVVTVMNKVFNFLHFSTDLMKQLDVSGLKDESPENVVENWRKGMVYVVHRPRTDKFPGSPQDLKLISWLQMHNIPHQLYSHPLFYSAQFTEQLPFVELNGQQIVGSTDTIIQELQETLALNSAAESSSNKEEKAVRKLVEKTLYRILLYDRSQGLEFVVNDAQIREQLMPLLLEINNAKAPINTPTGIKEVALQEKFWREYLELGTVRQGGQPGDLRKKDEPDWNGHALSFAPNDKPLYANYVKVDLPKQMRDDGWGAWKGWKSGMLRGARDLMKFQLMIQRLEIDYSHKTIAELSAEFTKDEPIVAALKKVAEKLAQRLEHSKKQAGSGKKFFLFGKQPTPADCALYALLVQFLDTPLNVKGIHDYFAHIKQQQAGHVFNQFVAQFKALGHGVARRQTQGAVGSKYSGGPYALAPEHDEFDESEHETDIDLVTAVGHAPHSDSFVAKQKAQKAAALSALFKELPSLLMLENDKKKNKKGSKEKEVRVAGGNRLLESDYKVIGHILQAIEDVVNTADLNLLLVRAVHSGAKEELRAMYKAVHRNIQPVKKAHGELGTATILAHYAAAYLCNEGKSCAKPHLEKANAKLQGSGVDASKLQEQMFEFVHKQVYSYNEDLAQKKMKKLGLRMYKLNSTSQAKVSKWLKEKDNKNVGGVSGDVKDWLLKKLVELFKFKDEKSVRAMEQAMKQEL